MNSDIQTIITSVGFPIALSFYLLIRFEEKLQKLTDSINELSKNILSMRWWFMKFYLDFGHGGKDSGAVGVNGTFESNVVLKIGLILLLT